MNHMYINSTCYVPRHAVARHVGLDDLSGAGLILKHGSDPPAQVRRSRGDVAGDVKGVDLSGRKVDEEDDGREGGDEAGLIGAPILDLEN